MSELYIGTDLVDIDRIKISIEKYQIKFLDRVFSAEEQEYCQSKSNPAIHYAGRFAAKEAIKKALLSSGIVSNIDFAAIEILSSESGAPEVQLDHPQLDQITCEVSISHTDDTAIAFALVRV